jgi:hypothetical protein
MQKIMTSLQIKTKIITQQISSKNSLIQNYNPSPGFNKNQEVNLFKSIPRQHKKQKPISRGTYENSRLSRVYQLDMKDPVIRDIPRAGFVFYTFIEGELYMSFGRDRESGDLTDYGGTRMKKQNESSIRCAIREGNEESRYAFSKITIDQIQGFCCLYSSNMLIVFVPVASPNNVDIREITAKNFNESRFLNSYQKKDRRYNEISEIVWLNESQISNLFSEYPTIQMYSKVRQFIYSCNQLSKDIKIMKNILRSIIIDEPQHYDIEKFYITAEYDNEDITINSYIMELVY